MDTERPAPASPKTPRTARPARRRAPEDVAEKGYVMALTALLLIPMLVFTAFATDVGAWYVRAQEIQRAADAAALAAVVWMPDEDTATDYALDVAARNGFVDQPGEFDQAGVDLPQVRVSQVGAQRVRVDIRAEGDLYFGSVIESFDEPVIHRYATAEYVLPVIMGNPTSALGTGSESYYGEPDNFFLNSNGRCRQRRDGDIVSTEHSRNCDVRHQGGELNPVYDAEGHAFIVDVPEDPVAAAAGSPGLPSGNFVLQARISCYRNWTGPNHDPELAFTLYEPDDTALNDYDNEIPARRVTNPPVSVTRGSSCPGSYTPSNDAGTWVDIANLSAAGRYVLRAYNVKGDDATETSEGVYQAMYSLRVHRADLPSNSVWGCSRIANPALATWDLCPNISAREWMTVVTEAAMLGNPSSSEAVLNLAEIGAEHAGKTLEITLFDAADGLDYVQVLDPFGTPQELEWQAIDNSVFDYGTHGGNDLSILHGWDHFDDGVVYNQRCNGGSEPCLKDPDPTFYHLAGGSPTNQQWLQDRTVRMLVELPNTYACDTSGGGPADCWWQVKYVDTGGNIGEVTSWSVRVIGDPVRLIE